MLENTLLTLNTDNNAQYNIIKTSIIPDTVRCTTAASQTIQIIAATVTGIAVTAAQ